MKNNTRVHEMAEISNNYFRPCDVVWRESFSIRENTLSWKMDKNRNNPRNLLTRW